MLFWKRCSDAFYKLRKITGPGRVSLRLSVHLASIFELYTKIAESKINKSNLLAGKKSFIFVENKFNKSTLFAENKFDKSTLFAENK